jgi:hypothetical protein
VVVSGLGMIIGSVVLFGAFFVAARSVVELILPMALFRQHVVVRDALLSDDRHDSPGLGHLSAAVFARNDPARDAVPILPLSRATKPLYVSCISEMRTDADRIPWYAGKSRVAHLPCVV